MDFPSEPIYQERPPVISKPVLVILVIFAVVFFLEFLDHPARQSADYGCSLAGTCP